MDFFIARQRPSGQPQSNVAVIPNVEEAFSMNPAEGRKTGADLSSTALLEAARKKTGLVDWGDEAFREPLDVYLKAVRESANFHPMGQKVLARIFHRLLSNRLLVRKDLADHPEILDVPLRRPLYVIGLPRTGTTLLHNLLACDPAARSIKLWQGLYPSPPPTVETINSDPRIAAARKLVATFDRLAPNLAKAHALNPTGPEECLWLLEHSFVDFIHELRAYVPAYSDWLIAHENDLWPYQEYIKMLKLLAWKTSGDHWVLKAPRHLMSLRVLLEVVPDARIVQTHRNPNEVLPSLCSLCEIDRAIFTESPNRNIIGDHWFKRLRDGFLSAIEVRSSDNPDRYFDVDYRQLVADPIEVVRKIHSHHCYPFTPEFEKAMHVWLADNRQHKHGPHRYRLDDYGLTPSQVDAGFAEYKRCFSDWLS